MSSRDRVRSMIRPDRSSICPPEANSRLRLYSAWQAGVAVAEPAHALLGEVQAEAQARGVDPPVADLAQAPCSRVPRQGICDLGQALRIPHGRRLHRTDLDDRQQPATFRAERITAPHGGQRARAGRAG
jgi:hypothetical protein